jgi:hypothetical protein
VNVCISVAGGLFSLDIIHRAYCIIIYTAAAESEIDTMQRCASCGIAEGDDIKLKKCTACHLVRYCSVKCQKEHRKQHKKECKKRAAELKDEILFKQPESSHLGDCPICCLPHPIDLSKSMLYPCCSKYICKGCSFANEMREYEEKLQPKCPFCRKDKPKSEDESDELLMKRVEVNDPVVMRHFGAKRYTERYYEAACEYLTTAADLGDVDAHYQLSILYMMGKVSRRTRKRHCIIQNRLQSEGTHLPGTILDGLR